MKLPRLNLFLTLALALTAPLATAQTAPPGPPTSAASAMFTLEDLWNRLKLGTPGILRTGSFAEPTGAPGVKTMHTLNELMGAAPSVDDANGATVADVLLGKTFWGLTGGAWGLRTGTLAPLVAGADITGGNGLLSFPIPNANYTGKTATASDTNLVVGNIKAGVTVFGVAGTAPVPTGNAAAGDVLAGKTFNAAATEAGGAGVKAGGGAGRSLGGHVRVLTARRRSNSSTRWLARQLNDPYVRAAKAAGYRSRAAYKLIELDEQFGLFAGLSRVIDLGAAPGGWCQAVLAARPKAKIVAIDLLEMEPLPGVTIFVKDVLDDDAPALLREALGGSAQLVLSDMAANTVGHKPTDHIRTMALVQTALDFAVQMLGPGGAFVAKVLAGGADPELVSALKRHFATVRHAKPPASRKGSSEWYVVGQGFKGLDGADIASGDGSDG